MNRREALKTLLIASALCSPVARAAARAVVPEPSEPDLPPLEPSNGRLERSIAELNKLGARGYPGTLQSGKPITVFTQPSSMYQEMLDEIAKASPSAPNYVYYQSGYGRDFVQSVPDADQERTVVLTGQSESQLMLCGQSNVSAGVHVAGGMNRHERRRARAMRT